jgi:hypothetical protein
LGNESCYITRIRYNEIPININLNKIGNDLSPWVNRSKDGIILHPFKVITSVIDEKIKIYDR